MKKILRLILIVIILSIIMIIPIIRVNAVDETKEVIGMESNDEFKAGEEISIKVKILDTQYNVDTIIANLEYDENVIETITEENMTPGKGWNYPMYNEEEKLLMIEKNNTILETSDMVVEIKMKIKENITGTSTKIKLLSIELASMGEDIENVGQVEKVIGEQQNENEDEIYLKSEKYKIGNSNINVYEQDDKYISKIDAETTVAEFKNNLETNGNINIEKTDGTEVNDEDFVGTGMKLKITKDEEEIILIISVTGDISGDGKITITDLSELNQVLLETKTLENEYKIAADLDENDKITITDLSQLNQSILESN